MKVLWLVNMPLPEASSLLNEEQSPYGGWLINASNDLSIQQNIDLSIAFPSSKTDKFKQLNGEHIKYYVFPPIDIKNFKETENSNAFKELLQKVKPDIVHAYGTEFAHTLMMVNACNDAGIKIVVSIQGLVSVYAKHVSANLPLHVIYGFTLRNLLLKDNIFFIKRKFQIRGIYEVEALNKIENVIGRTDWDRASSLQINPKLQYYFCNETLREEFYHHKWDINKCERHSIFLSQGQYSFKGLHYILEAMPLILKRFPAAKIYIGGKNIIKSETLTDKLLLTNYGIYIKNIIKKLNLNNNVFFTGPLSEKRMCQQYLKSHVFVCPSSIENSPNSLGEAMILGVPCVASNVGGVPDMMKHKEEGFIYQTDAPYMLANYICEIFQNDDLALGMSKAANKHSLKTHNKRKNTETTVNIYKKILNQK